MRISCQMHLFLLLKINESSDAAFDYSISQKTWRFGQLLAR